jgi:type II secretory pathway predicted ATPase ExeA
MWETFFGFKKTPFADNPDAKQLFASHAWQQVKTRLEFLAQHRGVGLLTGEVGSGKSTAARAFTSALPANQYKILYVHFSAGSALDLLRQIALELNLTPARLRGDLVRQIADAVVRLNQNKKQHPLLICDEAQLLPHPALEQLPLLLNFDMAAKRSQLRCDGFFPLPHTAAHRSALVAQDSFAATARSPAPARWRALSPGGSDARRTRLLSHSSAESGRRDTAVVR